MPVYPSLKTDIVRYEPTDVYADQNIKITLLDGSTLEIWGTAFYNGNPLTTIGALPIATQAEAEAGVDNTKVMTPLRVNQAFTAKGAYTKAEADAKFVDVAGDIMTGPLDVLRVIITQAPSALNHATRKDYVDAGDTAAKAYADSIVAGINVGTLNIYTKPEVDAKFVDTAGDTMTGNLVLAADPGSAMQAATKQYVDGRVASITVGSLNLYTKAEADAKFVDTAGDTMTGPLVVPTLTVNGLSLMRSIQVGVGQGSIIADKVIIRDVPAAPSDGTNKNYVDVQTSTLQTYVDTQDNILKAADTALANSITASFPTPGYAIFPGTVGNFLSIPDANNLDFNGDFCIVVKVAPVTWLPPALQTFVVKLGASAGSYSYGLRLTSSGILSFLTSPDGTATSTFASTAGLSALPDGSAKWIAAVYDADNGASGRSVTFWTSDDGNAWTQLGAVVTQPGAQVIFNSTVALGIGARSNGAEFFNGNIYYAAVKSGIGAGGTVGGTDVFRFDGLGIYDKDASSFVCSTGQTVTVNRSGSPSTQLVPVYNSATYPVESKAALKPHLFLNTGATGGYLSIPDPPQLAGATQLDIRWIEKAPPNGVAGYVNGVILAQAYSTSTNYAFTVTSATGAANANFSVSNNGTTPTANTFRVIRPTTGIGACRITWRASDGRVQFFNKATADVAGMNDNTGWTQVSADLIAVCPALFDSPAPMRINTYSNTTPVTTISLLALSVATTIDGTPFTLWRSDTMDTDYLDQYGVRWTLENPGWEWRDSSGATLLTPTQVADNQTALVPLNAPRVHLSLVPLNNISMPRIPALAGATGLDIRCIERQPVGGYTVSQQILGQSFPYSFVVNATNPGNLLRFGVCTDGTGNGVSYATVQNVRPGVNGGAWRVTWRASDGRVQLFTKNTLDVSAMLSNTGWTQVGSDSVLPMVSGLFDTPGNFRLNGYPHDATNASGNMSVYALSMANAIDGTPAALWRSDQLDSDYLDPYGTRWTLNGTGYEWRDNNGVALQTASQDADNLKADLVRANSIAASYVGLYLPGSSGTHITTPDPPQLAGATQLDIRWLERPSTYVGSLIITQGTSTSNNCSFYILGSTTPGMLSCRISSNGTGASEPPAFSGVSRPALGQIGACRVTWRASDGRAQIMYKVTADVSGMLDNTGWVVASTSTQATGPLFDHAAVLSIGAYSNGSAPNIGTMYAASVATTIDGTPFALWRSDLQSANYTDQYGIPWTVNGTNWEWRDPGGYSLGGPVNGNSSTLTGVGYPEGIVPANIGTRYIDTVATNGAVEWIKTISNGTTGWRVVYGDTGLRTVTSLITAPTGVTILAAYLRRVNSTVSWKFLWNTTASPGGGAACYNVPTGFKYHEGGSDTSWPYFNGLGVFMGAIGTISGGTQIGLYPAANGSPRYGFEYTTADTVWPATLP